MKMLVTFFIVIGLTGLAATSDCPESCNCNDGSMKCTGISKFVNYTDIPENITLVTYDFCSFQEISTPLMYRGILELRIRNGGLERISDGVFTEMSALKTLDLRNNTLRVLSSSVFSGLSALRDLFLSQNQLSTLPERFFAAMPTLMQVELDDNKPFQFTSSMFFNVSSSLTRISCKRCDINNLASVTEALSGVNLTELSLSGNHLLNLWPYALSKLPLLEILSLDNCSIESVNDSAFADLKKLHGLNLSRNFIRNLPSDTFLDSKTSLQVIFLNDNLLSSLDDELLQWPSVQQLYLDNNPWNCDCSLNFIRSHEFESFSPNATCKEPESLIGSSVFSYSISCEDKTSSIVVLAIVIPIIIICVLVIGCFVFRAIQTMVNRKRQTRDKSSFRYSAVYKETVEPAAGLRPKTAETGESYRPKQNLRV